MIPTLHSSAVITPGQFGPINLAFVDFKKFFTFTISCTGIPSVMQTIRRTPASADSMIASAANGYTIYNESEAYSLQNPAYFRADIRVSVKWNRSHHTSILSLDIQNLTNRQNVYGEYYDAFKGELKTIYQTGLIPVLNYSIEF